MFEKFSLISFLVLNLIVSKCRSTNQGLQQSITSNVGNYSTGQLSKLPNSYKPSATKTIEQVIIKNLLKGYDWRIRPQGLNDSWSDTGGPVSITVNIFFRSISKIDDVNMVIISLYNTVFKKNFFTNWRESADETEYYSFKISEKMKIFSRNVGGFLGI